MQFGKLDQALKELKRNARPDQLEGMARYGMDTKLRLGISIPDLRKMARDIGKDHRLAQELWDTGFQEARILAAMIDDPAEVTEHQLEKWVKEFSSWDVCDQVCMNLFEKVPCIERKIKEWSQREEEFVKRAAFSLIACLAWHKKNEPDSYFMFFLPIIKAGAGDGRNYVKKAVSWALRHIGKRNLNLNKIACAIAREIHELRSGSARWIASDVLRELQSDKVAQRLKKKW